MALKTNTEDITSKTNTWPISNNECQKWAKSQRYHFQVYL